MTDGSDNTADSYEVTGGDGRWCAKRATLGLAVVAFFFLLAYLVGSKGWLASAEPSLMSPIALTVVGPILLFLLAFAFLARFRRFMLAQDLRMLTALQLWRVIGFAFLLVLALDGLPPIFAWPAGLGDLAIGFAAAVVLSRLLANPRFAGHGGFLAFHLLGLMDFVVAIVAANLTSGVLPGLVSGGITSAPLEVWPLNVFPSFLVPFFVIAHLIALFQFIQIRRSTIRHQPTA
ncbi:hypothetical protein [Limibacillus halophilus]|uniref:Uncharacterized protein n=1 Tax=Limibacillus halophilus TaxID=1579333 RepID=A0A839STP1_9PROT|nr:hypothetical protein [Limibacillus halophilus]MBB3064766.1 hypothetical protein [Limibacillus halophilus]